MHELTFTPDWNGGTFNKNIEIGNFIEVREFFSHDVKIDNSVVIKEGDYISYSSIIESELREGKEIDYFFKNNSGNLVSLKKTIRTPKTFVYIKE